jgi:hypothetical protein
MPEGKDDKAAGKKSNSRLASFEETDDVELVRMLTNRLFSGHAAKNNVERRNAENKSPLDPERQTREQKNVKYTSVRLGSLGTRTYKQGPLPSDFYSSAGRSSAQLAYEVLFIFSKDDKYERTEIEISGNGLKALIFHVIRHFVEHGGTSKEWTSDGTVHITSRYVAVFHYWDALRDLSACGNEIPAGVDARVEDQEYLRRLLNDIEALEPQRVKGCQDRMNSNSVSYGNLLYYFTPGQYMVAFPFLGEPQLFLIDYYNHNPDEKFKIEASAYDWDGVKLMRMGYEFVLEKFDDPMKINELPFYPVEFFEDDTGLTGLPALRKKIRERGRKFQGYCKCQKGERMFEYNGTAMVFARHATEKHALSVHDWTHQERIKTPVFNPREVSYLNEKMKPCAFY